MRWWWLIALAGCPSKPKQKPHDAAIARVTDAATDAAIDAPSIVPQDGEVAVGAFAIDKLETTIAEYRACVDANICAKTERGIEIHGKHPEEAMGGVTFLQARAYCEWKGKRLPTPAEWNRAAYGDGPRVYPWGDDPMTCERAVFAECKVDGPVAPGGRPAGASPYGALDMVGNVSEWTDPGVLTFPTACVTPPRVQVPLLGGEFFDRADGPSFKRDNGISNAPVEFDNRDQGIRCARGPIAAAPPTRDPVLTATTWTVTPAKSASDAIQDVMRRCKAGEQALWIAGELVGAKGWAIATAGPGVPPPKDLVRVIGRASCNFDETTRLTATVDGKRTRMVFPSEVGLYQVWLRPGTWVTLEIECRKPEDKGGPCSFATMIPPPVRFRVPAGPASGVEGPALVADGGTTCD